MNKRLMRLIWIGPLAIIGMVVFVTIGGGLVMYLWNWLVPTLFGWRLITFWQALGLLVLCRILFGGFRLGAHGSTRSRIRERINERMAERWEKMTPEEREKYRQSFRACWGSFEPPDSKPNP